MKCKICRERRPRRYCPGVNGDICSVCCGEEREVTVDCPLDCEYLQEARLRDRIPEPDPSQFPNQDIAVTESFLRSHEPLLLYMASMLVRHSFEPPTAVDHDVREALDSLVRTYRTLHSGLVYETMPANSIAGALHQRMQASIAEFRQMMSERGATRSIRDVEILGVLAFLQRLEIQHNNGRRKGRAFIDFLTRYFVPPPPQSEVAGPGPSLLIIP